MEIKNLKVFESGNELETDLLIIGGGAAGLSIAYEFLGESRRVLIAESGDTVETDEHELLNEVDFDSSRMAPTWHSLRSERYLSQTSKWSNDIQRFGVRCRGLGGSTAAWGGKCAPFTAHDFVRRDWLPFSGWPFDADAIEPFVRRAEQRLNLGAGPYDDEFWKKYAGKGRQLRFNEEVFSSFFWQFARSRSNPVDMLRMGSEYANETAPNVRVLVNATARKIAPLGEDGWARAHLTGFGAPEVVVKARKIVVACGALENARLLLSSTSKCPAGLGNDFDQVGRYLMDHLSSRIVQFEDSDTLEITSRFGFFGMKSGNRVHMYSHGLGLNLPVQARDELVNSAVYCFANQAEDDPWAAAYTLLRVESTDILRDISSILKAPGMMFTGAGRIFLQNSKVPSGLKNLVVDNAVRFFPNFVVEEYQTQGVPHKLTSCGFEAIVEQEPLPQNRVFLSKKTNDLNIALPKIEWEPGERSIMTLKRTGEFIVEEFKRVGLPTPNLSEWIVDGDVDAAPIMDMAHTAGTTRMSEDPATGAVDSNSKLRHCDGVYMAGGSVLPTCSHVNLTLQIVAMSIRLADHLKSEFSSELS